MWDTHVAKSWPPELSCHIHHQPGFYCFRFLKKVQLYILRTFMSYHTFTLMKSYFSFKMSEHTLTLWCQMWRSLSLSSYNRGGRGPHTHPSLYCLQTRCRSGICRLTHRPCLPTARLAFPPAWCEQIWVSTFLWCRNSVGLFSSGLTSPKDYETITLNKSDKLRAANIYPLLLWPQFMPPKPQWDRYYYLPLFVYEETEEQGVKPLWSPKAGQ